MQVTATNSLSAAATADTSNRVVQKQLGQGDFLKLLTVQLQQQDPMKPMDDTQSIAQMAQFSSLQQMAAISDGIAAMRLDSQLASAGTLLGREVTVSTTSGKTVTGVVDAVAQTADGPTLTIGGQAHAYGKLVRVAPAPVPADGAAS